MSIITSLFFPISYTYEETIGKQYLFLDKSSYAVYVDQQAAKKESSFSQIKDVKIVFYKNEALTEKELHFVQRAEKIQKQIIACRLKIEEEKAIHQQDFFFRGFVHLSDLITFTPTSSSQKTAITKEIQALSYDLQKSIDSREVSYPYPTPQKYLSLTKEKERSHPVFRKIVENINALKKGTQIIPRLPSYMTQNDVSQKEKDTFLKEVFREQKENKEKFDLWQKTLIPNQKVHFEFDQNINLSDQKIKFKVKDLSSEQLHIKAIQGALFTATLTGTVAYCLSLSLSKKQ